MSARDEFAPGLLGQRCWLELAGGERMELPVHRWRQAPSPGDEPLLDPCTGPTLDLGCGPGRLLAELGARGISALGVDRSAVAVRLARESGGTALRRDVFDRLPAEGRWNHVLLADGNIGIGGDPVRLLRRVAALLDRPGTAHVELDPPGSGLRRAPARVVSGSVRGQWFPWAWLSADEVPEVAGAAALRVRRIRRRGGRWFADLAHRA